MTRRPNTARRNLMLDAAFKLFKEKGYEHTTYQDISDAMGTTRTIVQSYFPKKTRFTEEIYNEILRLSYRSVVDLGIGDDSPNKTLSMTCQVFFSYLLNGAPMQRFTKTTLSVREGTAKNIVTEIPWIVDFCKGYFEDDDLLGIGYLMALGGAYEVIYRNLCNGIPTDTMLLTNFAVSTFITIAGTPDEDKVKLLMRIPDEQLVACCRYIDDNLFKTKAA